ncbi:type II toxin-antitoxin system toxin ribonuclease VapC11 [soil metagenome]
MTPARILVDTSAWIETIRAAGEERVRAAVSAAAADDRAVICDMVLLELWNGARSDEDRRTLRALEERVECVPTAAEAWRLACRLAVALRKKGATVPAADLVIAACAQHHGLELLHRDSHFDRIYRVIKKGQKRR